MKYLLDTQILLWIFIDPDNIHSKVRDILLKEENSIFYSPVSLWEIAIKYKTGKLKLKGSTPEEFYSEVDQSFLICKTIENEELISSYHLPKKHKDPFDRLLIWQAIKNDLFFISADKMIKRYKEFGLKLVD